QVRPDFGTERTNAPVFLFARRILPVKRHSRTHRFMPELSIGLLAIRKVPPPVPPKLLDRGGAYKFIWARRGAIFRMCNGGCNWQPATPSCRRENPLATNRYAETRPVRANALSKSRTSSL